MQERIGWFLSDLNYDSKRDRNWDIDANWMLYVDNYLEGFHIPYVHPELNEALFDVHVMICAINAIYSDPNLENSPQCIVCKIIKKDKEKCKHLFKDCPRLNNNEETK